MNLTTILTKTLVHVHAILLHKKERCLDARKNLSDRFKDWFYEEYKIKSKTSQTPRTHHAIPFFAPIFLT